MRKEKQYWTLTITKRSNIYLPKRFHPPTPKKVSYQFIEVLGDSKTDDKGHKERGSPAAESNNEKAQVPHDVLVKSQRFPSSVYYIWVYCNGLRDT